MTMHSTSEARHNFAELVNQVAYGKTREVLSRRGKPVVAMIPIEDLERLEALEDKEDIRDARAALKEPATTRVKLSGLKDELGL